MNLTIYLFLTICLSIYLVSYSFTITHECILNDNFCDCGDDEPLTSACSSYSTKITKFNCIDKRYIEETIFGSRVNDGICDCCDGSDEDVSIGCVNRCDIIGIAATEEKNRIEKITSEGLVLKNSLTKIYKEKITNLKDKITKMNDNLPKYNQLLSSYKLQFDELTSNKDNQMNKISSFVKDHLTGPYIGLSRDTSISLLALLTLESKEEGVEKILSLCTGKLEFEGEEPDDTEALILVMGYNSLLKDNNMNEIEIDVTNIDIVTQVKLPLREMANYLSLERVNNIQLHSLLMEMSVLSLNKGVLLHSMKLLANFITLDQQSLVNNIKDVIINESLNNHSIGSIKTDDTLNIKAKIKELESQIANLIKEGREAETTTKFKYGPSDAFYGFYNACYIGSSREYQYEACIFSDAKQNRRTVLGHYDRYEIIDNSLSYGKELYLFFTHGERCQGTAEKQPRSFTIHVECDNKDTMDLNLYDIGEPEVCAYTATIKSPLGCF